MSTGDGGADAENGDVPGDADASADTDVDADEHANVDADGAGRGDETGAAPGAGDLTAGSRVVYAIYAASVCTAGVFGLVLGFVLDGGDAAVGSIGPVSFALSPLNLALYGMVMVGLALGVGLALVRVASRHA